MERGKAAQSPVVFALLAVTGGFLEAFTYFQHGGVFCNAQTGNLVLLAIKLAQGQFVGALEHLYCILAYLAGIFLSLLLPRLCKRLPLPLTVVTAEFVCLAALAFVPETAADIYTYVSVSFLCALQYNSFTECLGAKAATTFCTNNLRQLVIHLFRGAADRDRTMLRRSAVYAGVILFFAGGAIVGAFAVQGGTGNAAVALCCALLLPVIVLLLIDLRRGKKQPPLSPLPAPAAADAAAADPKN